MTKTHYHPSLLFSDQQYVKGACGLRGRCPLSAASAESPRIRMNIKYEFQLSPGYRSLPQRHPRCACPQTALWIAWIDLGRGSLPCPCLTTPAYGGDPRCHHPALLTSLGAVGTASCHRGPFPPRSAPTSPLPAPLPGLPWGNAGKDALVLFITASIGTPGLRRPSSGTFPDYGTEKLTFGQ